MEKSYSPITKLQALGTNCWLIRCWKGDEKVRISYLSGYVKLKDEMARLLCTRRSRATKITLQLQHYRCLFFAFAPKPHCYPAVTRRGTAAYRYLPRGTAARRYLPGSTAGHSDTRYLLVTNGRASSIQTKSAYPPVVQSGQISPSRRDVAWILSGGNKLSCSSDLSGRALSTNQEPANRGQKSMRLLVSTDSTDGISSAAKENHIPLGDAGCAIMRARTQ